MGRSTLCRSDEWWTGVNSGRRRLILAAFLWKRSSLSESSVERLE